LEKKTNKLGTMSESDLVDDDTLNVADVSHLQFWQVGQSVPLGGAPGRRYAQSVRSTQLTTLASFGLLAFIAPSQQSVVLVPVADLLHSAALEAPALPASAVQLAAPADVTLLGLSASSDGLVLALVTSKSTLALLDTRRAWHSASALSPDARYADALFHTVEHPNGVRSAAWAPASGGGMANVQCLALACGQSALGVLTVDSMRRRVGQLSSALSGGAVALCWRRAATPPRVAVALVDGSVTMIDVFVDAANPLNKPRLVNNDIKNDLQRIAKPRTLPAAPCASIAWPLGEHLVVGYRTQPAEEDDDPLPYCVIDPRVVDEPHRTVRVRLEHDLDRPSLPLAVPLEPWGVFVLGDTSASMLSLIGCHRNEDDADEPLEPKLIFTRRSSCR
jgi:hypothetical protein